VAKEDRGFASMDRAKQREIASKGGKAAHQKGTAHEWTSEEARDAGRKGGIASHRRRREQMGGGTTDTADDRTSTRGGSDETSSGRDEMMSERSDMNENREH
jgi:general stress protein YciG